MAVVPFTVEVGDEVRIRDHALGRVAEIFNGPPRSVFVDTEPYLLVKRGTSELFVPFSEIADMSRLLGIVYLKPTDPSLATITWGSDPRLSGSAARMRAQIGDRFREGEPIVQPGEYICTACGFRKHSRQLANEAGGNRFPPPHHPGAFWALDDYRP
jgi:hypothetical protein